MEVRCLHCHERLDVPEESDFSRIVCSSCGGTFSLVGERTVTYEAQNVRRFGRFELIEQVGAGAFGSVWKARDTELDRVVALKIPRKGQIEPEEAERFLREARSAAQLRHPNIVSVHEVGRQDGTVYIVSDYVQGATLDDWLTGQKLTAREAAMLCAKIADALEHAHQAGIIHRDLKPSNIVLDLAGEPHLMDFGLARRRGGEETMTMDGRVLGTPAYMSPEQARGEAHQADQRTDIYSLGVILFRLLTGELPFRGSRDMLIVQILREEPPSPRKLNHRVPRDLETITLKCLEKNPERRYAAARTVAEELRRFLRDEPIQARPVARSERLWRWSKRNSVVAGLAAMIAALLVVALIGSSAAAVRFSRLATKERQATTGLQTALTDLEKALAREERLRTDAEQAREKAETARQHETEERHRAEALARKNRLDLYVAQLNLAQQAWEQANVGRALELLEAQRPRPTEDDLRGFEWYYLWRLCHGERLTIQSSVDAVRSVAFAPDGTTLASCNGSTATLWNTDTGQVQGVIPLGAGDARCVAFSPDGSTLAVGGGTIGQSGVVVLWDMAGVRRRARLMEFADPVLALAFSPDGQILATGTAKLQHGWGNPLTRLIWIEPGQRAGEVKLWDVASGRLQTTPTGETAGILSLAFSPDGTTLAAGGWDAAVHQWDLATGTIRSHRGFVGAVWSVTFSPGGDLAAAAGKWDGQPELRLWLGGKIERLIQSGHAAGLTSVAFANDGKLATASWDRTVKLWQVASSTNRERTGDVLLRALRLDVAAGAEARTLRGHTNYVSSIAFSPDGKRLASGSWDGSIKLWYSDESLDHVTFRGLGVGGYSVAFSTDQRFLATAGREAVTVWELARGEVVASLPNHGADTLVLFSADGETLATTGMDATVRVYDVATWKRRCVLQGHATKIWAFAITRDGALLATGSQDGTARLWELPSGKERATLPCEVGGTVRSVAFSTDGRMLAAAVHVKGNGKSVMHVWDVGTHRTIATWPAHDHNIECVAFSPDGETLATSSHDTTAKLWDTSNWRERATLKGHVESIYHIAFTPDGRTLATAGWDGDVRLWNVATGQPLVTLKGHIGTVWHVAFSKDGKMLASGSSYQDKTVEYGRVFEVKLWHAAREDEVLAETRPPAARGRPVQTLLGHRAGVRAMAYSPDGSLLASADVAGTVLLWDTSSVRPPRSIPTGHTDHIRSVAFSRDRRTLATASLDGTARLFDTLTASQQRRLDGHTGQLFAVAFSSDGQLVATAGEDKSIMLWNAGTGDRVASLTGHAAVVSSVAFAPDGRTLASASWDQTVRVWDLAAFQERHRLEGPHWGLTSVAFSPDGRRLAGAVGFGDPSIYLWDTSTGEKLATLYGHTHEISSVAFTDDNKLLLSASDDKRLGIWDVAASKLLAFAPHDGPVWSVATPPAGDSFSTGGADGVVRLWSRSVAIETAARSLPPRLPRPVRLQNIAIPNFEDLRRNQRWPELAAAAEQALKILPHDKLLHQFASQASFHLGKFDDAAQAAQKHSDLCDNCTWAAPHLARCRLVQGSYEEAANVLEQFVKRHPKHATPLNTLAWVYAIGPASMQKPDRALELARQAVEAEPDNSDYHNTLGIAYYRTGDVPKAIETLKKSAELAKDGPTAFDLFFLAMSHQRLGQLDKAREYYDQATAWRQSQSSLLPDSLRELEVIRAEADKLLMRTD